MGDNDQWTPRNSEEQDLIMHILSEHRTAASAHFNTHFNSLSPLLTVAEFATPIDQGEMMLVMLALHHERENEKVIVEHTVQISHSTGILSHPSEILMDSLQRCVHMNVIALGKKIISGRDDYTPRAKAIVEEFGDEIITSVTINRVPMSSMLQTVASNVKGGVHEKYYHLSLILTSKNQRQILLEKDFVVKLKVDQAKRPNTESMPVLDFNPMTLNQLLYKTERNMGDKFWKYSAADSNCQHFVLSLLRSLLDNQTILSYTKFVEQDVSAIFMNNKGLGIICNVVTGLEARVEIAVSGIGRGRRNSIS
jgi:hypothetical protein